ncbi:MAG: DMT family transporter [Gemmatimonadetes bacterium]|nr:DMT family transporter [Gemmatimonadota bacterium]
MSQSAPRSLFCQGGLRELDGPCGAYFLSICALGRTASSLVAMYVYLQPLITSVAAPLLLGEQVTARAGVAAGLIFAGLALATWGEQAAGRQLGAAFRPPSEGV